MQQSRARRDRTQLPLDRARGGPEQEYRSRYRQTTSRQDGSDRVTATLRPVTRMLGPGRQRRARQRELAGEGCHLVGADLVARLAVLAITMQRDRATSRPERPHAFVAVFDPELLVEQ